MTKKLKYEKQGFMKEDYIKAIAAHFGTTLEETKSLKDMPFLTARCLYYLIQNNKQKANELYTPQ